jgi:O-antigen ligase
MALVPWDFGTEMTNYRALMRGMSLIVPIIEICCILWALRLKIELFEPVTNFPPFEKIALAGLAGIAAFTSLFIAIDITAAVMGLLMWLVHLLFGITVFQIARNMNNPDFKSIFVGISIGLLAYLSILILYISMIEDPDQYNWTGLIPGIPNIRSLGFFSVAGFAAGAAISFRSSRTFHFPLGLFFASTAIGLAVWSATRGALFAILATVLFLFVQRSEYRNIRFVGWVTGVVAISVLLSTVSYKPNDQFGLNRLFASVEKSDGSVDGLSSGRVQVWKETVTEIAKRPLFGFGERQFRKVGPERARGLNQPHNIFLQIAFQWGIVGALLFFLLLARLALQVWRKTNRGKNMGIGEQILVISILVYSLYDAALFYPYPIMMFTLAVALALARPTQPAPAADR